MSKRIKRKLKIKKHKLPILVKNKKGRYIVYRSKKYKVISKKTDETILEQMKSVIKKLGLHKEEAYNRQVNSPNPQVNQSSTAKTNDFFNLYKSEHASDIEKRFNQELQNVKQEKEKLIQNVKTANETAKEAKEAGDKYLLEKAEAIEAREQAIEAQRVATEENLKEIEAIESARLIAIEAQRLSTEARLKEIAELEERQRAATTAEHLKDIAIIKKAQQKASKLAESELKKIELAKTELQNEKSLDLFDNMYLKTILSLGQQLNPDAEYLTDRSIKKNKQKLSTAIKNDPLIGTDKLIKAITNLPSEQAKLTKAGLATRITSKLTKTVKKTVKDPVPNVDDDDVIDVDDVDDLVVVEPDQLLKDITENKIKLDAREAKRLKKSMAKQAKEQEKINQTEEVTDAGTEDLINLGLIDPITGEGKHTLFKGLSNIEISEMMKKYIKKGFKGILPYDLLSRIKIDSSHDSSYILNLDKSNLPGSHWVALFIEPSRKTIEYFDPFGADPPTDVMKEIEKLVKRSFPKGLYQFKINRVKKQNAKTANCGFFSMQFIVDRINGKSFKNATGFEIIEDSMKGEMNIEKFKKAIDDFGYIK
jgi:hypothetical protein